MNRLTAEERRRAAELRRTSQTGPPRAIVAIQTVPSRPESRARSARVAALVTIALGGALALLELGHQLALYGSGSLLDWLLPRL